MKKWIFQLAWPIMLARLVYLWVRWSGLADQIPVHYGANGEADRIGAKSELLVAVGVLTAVNMAMFLILPRIYKIDPRKTAADNKSRLKGIAFAVSLLVSLIAFIIVDSAGKTTLKFQYKWIFAALGVFWCVLGNYMYNIKPNYFAGLRLPWTLNNEENWRLTHRLAGKLWFGTGILLLILAFLLPASWLVFVFMAMVFITVMVPVVYSYRIYAAGKF